MSKNILNLLNIFIFLFFFVTPVSASEWYAKAAKLHKESIRMYKEGKRDDLVEAEMNELQFVESYLPSMMNEDEVRSLVENIISEVGASQMSDFGKVMPQVMKQGAGKIDGNLAQSIVKELLS